MSPESKRWWSDFFAYFQLFCIGFLVANILIFLCDLSLRN